MDSNELRSKFLGFFEERGHLVVPSASLIPHDPSVLFTIAGMVPFKPYFLGDEKPPASRLTSVQKCFRTVDLDIVGSTTRHTTFFEMLGNFSFGDYFKEGAIDFAWELFTEALGVDGDKLWVTVHDTDDEAEEIWRDRVGVPANRIQRMGEDNFWKMGETGPCGPCSEIYYDKGASYGADGGPAQGGDERFVEIWNLVFMEKNNQDGQLLDLPTKNVDTGAGLERLLALLTGKDSIFDTSAFSPMLEAAQSLTGASYGKTEADDVRLRILADHARAMTILASDGVIPGNEGRGYVMRRVVRRAVLAARRLGSAGGVVEPLVDATVESMAGAYPILQSNRDQILATLKREEEGFDRTLRNGLKLLEEELASGVKSGTKVLSGTTAFTLHDTHGFPVELTEEIVAESGLSVDRVGFDAAMAEQQE
ncbi:MAG: alanine--tRNA ligase, partial [Actinomycetes bacterium]